jgi:hypothetical protein
MARALVPWVAVGCLVAGCAGGPTPGGPAGAGGPGPAALPTATAGSTAPESPAPGSAPDPTGPVPGSGGATAVDAAHGAPVVPAPVGPAAPVAGGAAATAIPGAGAPGAPVPPPAGGLPGPPPVAPGFAPPAELPTGAPSVPPPVAPTPTRSIEVSGPTLDNRFPQTWGTFRPEDGVRRQCAFVPNGPREFDLGPGAEVEVRIAVRVAAGAADFAVVDPRPGECTADPGGPVVGPCARTAVPPGSACTVGLATSVRDGADATGRLEYSLEAVCTSADPVACRGVSPAPSAAAPVRVHWGYSVALTACFAAGHQPDTSSSPARCTG